MKHSLNLRNIEKIPWDSKIKINAGSNEVERGNECKSLNIFENCYY
jgi:hypothetical protein